MLLLGNIFAGIQNYFRLIRNCFGSQRAVVYFFQAGVLLSKQTLPKALRPQLFWFGLVGFVWKLWFSKLGWLSLVWFGRFGLAGLAW